MKKNTEEVMKTIGELGFNKFKFRVYLNDNIVCKRNNYSDKSIEELKPHYDEVIKLIENYVNVENPKFHHNVLIRFSLFKMRNNIRFNFKGQNLNPFGNTYF